jgi:hypothetical protein
MPTREQLLNIAEVHARAVMIGGKTELIPVAHLIKADGGELVLGTPWTNDKEKRMTELALTKLMQAGDVVRYSIVCEAWAAAATEAELAAGLKPDQLVYPAVSARPDRVEIVVAIAVDREGHDVRVWNTKRDAKGACVDLVADDTGDHEGAFLDLLRDA